jgi:hypothetical protein
MILPKPGRAFSIRFVRNIVGRKSVFRFYDASELARKKETFKIELISRRTISAPGKAVKISIVALKWWPFGFRR